MKADILGIYWIRKLHGVMSDVFQVVWIFRHARNTVNVFEDSLTEAIILHNVSEVGAVDLWQKGARFVCVVTLSQKQMDVSLRVLESPWLVKYDSFLQHNRNAGATGICCARRRSRQTMLPTIVHLIIPYLANKPLES